MYTFQKQFELYLDESGDFNEGTPGHTVRQEPSMVGGILCRPGWMKTDRLNKLFRGKIHACSGYQKRFLDILQDAKNAGCSFVVFENTERIRIVDTNITYANIISEGLVHLFRDLAIEYPDGVNIKVVIAQRQQELKEYRNRIQEKIIMALGRESIPGVTYQLEISDARTDKRLYYADIICNTWLTQKRIKTDSSGMKQFKFTAEEQSQIARMFESKWIYSVFEDATTKYIKQLVLEHHYGEAMQQICTLPRPSGLTAVRNKVIAAIEKADSYEQDMWFSQVSLVIGQYNRRRLYREGIRFAENYVRFFLSTFSNEGHLGQILPFWCFDTDYYLLTMYDHLGNTAKCQEYLTTCRNNIDTVSRSWEHIDYYFSFCIRELNVMMGRFEFQEALQKAKELAGIFTEAQDLFSMIKTYGGKEQPIRSELLGKVYGIQLEAMINLLRENPGLFDEALKTSDKAIGEFTDQRDISRQYQYRCLLMTEARHPDEAYDALLKAAGVRKMTDLAETITAMKPGANDFLLWHYTNVMLLYKEENNPRGDSMYQQLAQNLNPVLLDSKGTEGHPSNLFLWNLGRYARLNGDNKTYKQMYRDAMNITRRENSDVTMMTFALSMCADRLLWCREHNEEDTSSAEMDLESLCRIVSRLPLTNEMLKAFGMGRLQNPKIAKNETLKKAACAYLK